MFASGTTTRPPRSIKRPSTCTSNRGSFSAPSPSTRTSSSCPPISWMPASSWPRCFGSSACSRTPFSSSNKPPRSTRNRTARPRRSPRSSRSSTSIPSSPIRASATPSWRPRPGRSRRPSPNSPRPRGWSRRRAAPRSSCAWPSDCLHYEPDNHAMAMEVAAKYLDHNNARAALSRLNRCSKPTSAIPRSWICWRAPLSNSASPTRPAGSQGTGARLRRKQAASASATKPPSACCRWIRTTRRCRSFWAGRTAV
jgi:hypothetical protein